MGVMPEIAQAVEDLDCLLPTDIQAESVPLILGGGDVLMATETGSGKTGAFSMPDEQEGKTGRASIKTGGTIFNNWQMNPYDRSPVFAIGPDGLCCQSREFKEWHGCRSTKGVTKGKYYYEVTCHDQGLCRIGWSSSQAALDLGNDLGVAFEIPQQLKSQPFFASCVLKNAELKFNFGEKTLKMPPRAPEGHAVKSTQAGSAKVSQLKATSNSPKALIIEPSKELAEQTLNNVIQCAKYVDNPKLRYDFSELWSEAIKILKGEYTVRAIKEHKMDQAIIFCRTKIDCDNMEQYFIQQGGGPDTLQEKIMINVTLPDEKQNYVHRIGRVGRAERMGLAISLVAMEKEKVWYHVCANRGRGCYNTRLKEDGGCAIWYKEKELLSDIEEHLKCTVTQCEPDIKVPLEDFDGKVTYGQRKALGGGNYKGHVDALAPTVLELANLEREAQSSFLHLGYMPNQLFRAF
ncbi:ATP-dependent RNA helicase DDX1 [Dissostichus eleginoides]|uniref:ATP-dependent RNA helicase DDX1 n=1 Tax=Dissostichus eleginoides TaxID=100907 RepID=A0AAD9BT27_DISEL|nr:ATP-dependent RNA helicase DDX1 [Dissostichus eleginoides]